MSLQDPSSLGGINESKWCQATRFFPAVWVMKCDGPLEVVGCHSASEPPGVLRRLESSSPPKKTQSSWSCLESQSAAKGCSYPRSCKGEMMWNVSKQHHHQASRLAASQAKQLENRLVMTLCDCCAFKICKSLPLFSTEFRTIREEGCGHFQAAISAFMSSCRHIQRFNSSESKRS